MRGHGGNQNVTSDKDIKYSFEEAWGKLFSYSKPFLPAIIIAILAAAGGSIFTILGPDRLSALTDTITEGFMTGIDMKAIKIIAFTLAGFYGMSVLLSLLQGFIMVTVTQKMSKGMRTDISSKINRLPLRYFDSVSYGDILSRVTNDVDAIGQTLNQSVASLVSAITLFIGSLFMMFRTNWIMTLVAIVSTIVGFMLMSLIISKSQKYFTQQQEYLGKINGHVEEVYNGHHVVKAYNAEEKLGKDFQSINEDLYNSGWKSQFLSGLMMPLMSFIGNFGYVTVSITGAVLAMNGKISFGVIVAFMVYIRLFTQPLSQMAQAATNLQLAGAASYRVFSFLGEEELEDTGTEEYLLDKVKGNIEFKNVEFGYEKDKKIIKNFSASVKSGQKIAIVGPTGAGKTTMVNLLMRFYEIDNGEITIDGMPISRLTRENVRDLFCMVLQDTWIFQGTVRENIVYSEENVSDEELVKVSKAVGLDHFINTLPKGYDTVLDEHANISEGQKQLMTIARAMIKNAPMLILDEATSSVDTRTEILIQKAMDNLMEGRTSFIIAHRLSTIKNADLILVMDNGDIVESGNHDDLLSQNGFYAELYNSQFDQGA